MDTIEKAMSRFSREKQEGKPQAVNKVDESSAQMASAQNTQSVGTAKHAIGADTGTVTKRSVTLDLEHIRQSGMVVPDDKRSYIKEEYRHIKRPLLMNAAGQGATQSQHANLIMVTSAKPGEGKTFTACNLALSLAAERDRTVLLVDADIVKPSLHKVFAFESGAGLVDYLIDDDMELADILVQTSVPSFMILPAGNTHHLSTELLASQNMRLLARELSERYPDRIVIFDSPPLLATTEASVLAGLVGQVVMVVEAEKTQKAYLTEALALLDPNMIIGCVLNKARSPFGYDYYDPYGGYGRRYGYGYGYGYYGQQ